MTAETSLFEQACNVTDEYLLAADICIKAAMPGGGILGYPAVLLLLCAADAIGHGYLPPGRDFTRLDVLADPVFGSILTISQAQQVKHWYRHLLAHSATMAVGVYLEPDANGRPFEFDTNGAPVLIRVGKLHEIVSCAWAQVKAKGTFAPPTASKRPDPGAQLPGFVSTLTPAASGVV